MIDLGLSLIIIQHIVSPELNNRINIISVFKIYFFHIINLKKLSINKKNIFYGALCK